MGLEDWIVRTARDPERRARAFQVLWVLSLAMVGLGYLLIADHYRGRLGWP